jgi:hypothetical protein
MRNLIRAELLKLRTVRGPWLVLAAGPLLVIAGISGLVVSGGNLHDPQTQAKALAHVGLTSIFPLRSASSPSRASTGTRRSPTPTSASPHAVG